MAMEAIRGRWADLGLVNTIYEDDIEDSSTSLSVSPEISPSPSPPCSRVVSWSQATGNDTDVVIRVEESRFRLHKDPLTARSGFLKRNLKGQSELTLSPPLKITAEIFSLIAEFCYDAHIVITPFNVAALRTAAELLEMTEANNMAGGENLAQKTEAYFRRVIAVNREYASIVLRSCVPLLPECETMSSVLSRCIEALSLADDGNGVMRCLNDVKELRPVDFQLVVQSMNRWLSGSHDQLYRVVDLYLKGYKGKISDEEKIAMCNYIDCTILSPQLLMHAVQNSRMPLRFVVQAMFVEQLNTRRSILTATAADNHHHHHINHLQNKNEVSLGTILERDAALRQVAQLKAAMNATSSRIQSLENELSGMRKLLKESDQNTKSNLTHDSARSASFRLSSENKIDRGQIGSVSSASFRILTGRERGLLASSNSSEVSYELSMKVEKSNFSRRFMNGLKSAFRVSKKKTESKVENVKEEDGKDVVVIKKDVPFRRQPRSQDQ
ncbi:BTB/POZ domain-containing protein At3g49900 [Nicotiana sylvestris]|uniref:BTB/POZ domain-containing protein At3g49900 n=1 Tax=Nicotiana sylvestris TaxID=4096 RepID=A0A1U7VAN1_NICSY|nr:PREDICTED: BTB/POZ domain-containing protein At3g49900 [Nicotiana sylvestris]XP_009765087.1 PREDICTED: BTB/POZ domain-containing protein At3g49900 [Nicotiana sylvestris]